MSNSITQSISIGAANTITVKPGEQIPKGEQRLPDQKELLNQTQISAQASTHTFAAKSRDKVAPQVPKRVESPYRPDQKKRRRGSSAPVEKREGEISENHLDVIA